MELREQPDKEAMYMISGERLERVQDVVLRMYREEGFNPDEMRDIAQSLEWVVLDAEEITN